MAGRFKTFQQNLLLLTISIIVTAIFAEIVLRVVLPPPIVWKYPQEQYQYDTDIGHWLEPNQQAYTHDKLVKTNSLGIRDSEYTTISAPRIYRILALGDSQTFGNGLELADTWPKQLENNLNQAGKRESVEVINAGLPGSDTWQHEIILNRLLSIYQPDAVVLAFYVNDVVERFTPKPEQQNKDKPLTKRITYILKRSALLLTLRTALDTIKQWWPQNKVGASHYNTLLKGDTSPDLAKRWKQVNSSLATMKKESDEYRAQFGIVLLPRRDQVSGQIPWEGYSNRLKDMAKQHQIPVISTLAPLQEAYMEHGKKLFIPWDGHNSKLANMVIAQEIADELIVVRKISEK